MAHFMYQLICTMGCSNVCSNIILSMFVKVFLDEINIWIGRLSKADCPALCGWVSSSQLKAWIEKREDPPMSKRELLLPDWWTGTSVSSYLWMKHWLLWSLKPTSFGAWTAPMALLGLQLANYRSWDLSAIIITWANFLY